GTKKKPGIKTACYVWMSVCGEGMEGDVYVYVHVHIYIYMCVCVCVCVVWCVCCVYVCVVCVYVSVWQKRVHPCVCVTIYVCVPSLITNPAVGRHGGPPMQTWS